MPKAYSPTQQHKKRSLQPTSSGLVRTVDESPFSQEGRDGSPSLQGQAVVELGEGGGRGELSLPPCLLLLLHLLNDGGKHGGEGDSPFAHALAFLPAATLGAFRSA